MNILLLGSRGQLGWELQRTLPPLGKVFAFDIDTLNLTDTRKLVKTVHKIHPDIIINASAYTAVDRAESEKDLAMLVNRDVPGILAQEANKISAALLHYSTDYVFDGKKGGQYTEDDICNPLNVYGLSKLAGEHAIREAGGAYLIFRTSWVYSMRKNSFVTKVFDWAKANSSLKVVTDQIGSPTWARMLAEISALLLSKASSEIYKWVDKHAGLYHLAGNGSASRFEVAQESISIHPSKEKFLCQEILPALTADFPAPAQRPLFTSLNCDLFSKTFGLSLPDWKDSLRLAIDEIQE